MVNVTSEIGRLKRALVHEPGLEVDRMVPATMDEQLFDDVLYGDRARQEHALFRRVLQVLGVDVVMAKDLLTATLEIDEARHWLLSLLPGEVSGALRERIQEAGGDELAQMLSIGVRNPNSGSGVEVQDLFEVSPIPNWCFQRDPQIILGDGVIFCAMDSPARNREALLARAIFKFHPDLASVPVIHDPLDTFHGHHLLGEDPRPRLEGGDVCVVSPDVVAVGHSARTSKPAIQALAQSLAAKEGGPRWLVVVELPKRRAYMHLDTVFTVVDHDAALVYPPVILGGGAEQARVYEIDLSTRELQPSPTDTLLGAFRKRGIDLEPIACGGEDPLQQQREQWTDGANALSAAPGVIFLYERNVGTTEELARRGFEILNGEDLAMGRAELKLEESPRACIRVPSTEISRARGGPHCLVHPLIRDAI